MNEQGRGLRGSFPRMLMMLATAVMVASLAQAQTGEATHDKGTTATAPADANPGDRIAGDPVPVTKQEETSVDKASPAKDEATDVHAVPEPSLKQTAAERKSTAWKMLESFANDQKHPQARIQAMAALGMLRSQESERMIGNGMLDNNLDVRTAAVLAAGETRDPNLYASLRNLLDDKEPQVAFIAAMTLAKMNDRSGEDILMAVADGDRKPTPGVLRGTEHKINRELHNPSKLARLGATQGAALLLGPFGFGITAIEYMRQSGGDAARASAIEQIAREKTEPIHRELVDALKDKDAAVRAAAAKALVDYSDQPTKDAVYVLLLDPKDPVRLTASAAYLRQTGVAGPLPLRPAAVRPARKQLATKPVAGKAK